MATTPNYGWVTPAPTDFVTDLPADFETFADAVDADLAGLLGGTTGQVLTKDSNTDHDFSWTTIVSGWQTIASGTCSGTTVDLTSIPGTYKNLRLIVRGITAAADGTVILRVNNLTSNYAGVEIRNRAATSEITTSTTSAYFSATIDLDNTNSVTSRFNWLMDLADYASTSTAKVAQVTSSYIQGNNDAVASCYIVSRANGNAAITSIQIASNQTMTGGTYLLLGLN